MLISRMDRRSSQLSTPKGSAEHLRSKRAAAASLSVRLEEAPTRLESFDCFSSYSHNVLVTCRAPYDWVGRRPQKCPEKAARIAVRDLRLEVAEPFHS